MSTKPAPSNATLMDDVAFLVAFFLIVVLLSSPLWLWAAVLWLTGAMR